MLTPQSLVWIVSVAVSVLGTDASSAQNYPHKPIRFVTGAPGGGGDFVARLMAQGLTGPLGQPVIVDNRGNIPGEIVAQALPDGYTLLVDSSSFLIGPLLQKMPYDAVKDFSPISWVVMSLNILAVHPSVPANSVKELIALAKAKPGQLNYGSGGAGSSTHLAAELFKSMAGIDIVRIPYKGAGPAMAALIAGEVQMVLGSAGSVTPLMKSGKLKALAVTSAQPSALFPGLPTMAATGVPGYESVAIHGIFAPVKTPAATVRILNEEVVRVVNTADVKEKFLKAGLETVGSSPEQFAAAIKSDLARMSKVIKEAGIKAD